MKTILLLAFSAVFTFGQGTGPWEGFSRLADDQQNNDDFKAAEKIRREALRSAEEQLGPSDKELAPLLTKLAMLLHFEGDDAQAEPMLRRAVRIGEDSGDKQLTGVAMNGLGVVLMVKDPVAAESLMRRSIGMLEQAEGKDNLDAAKARNNLATLYIATNRFKLAEDQMNWALPIYEKRLGKDNPAIAMALSNMFTVLLDEKRADEGEPNLRRALALGEAAFPHSLKMANLQLCLAALEASQGKYRMSARLYETAISTQEKVLGTDHPELARSLVEYADVLRSLHEKTEAKQAQTRASLILKSLHDVK